MTLSKVARGSRVRKTAFTLLELAVVIVILGTLAIISVPKYASFLAEQRVDAAARRLAADLAYAQRSAKMASSSQTVSFNVAGNSYTLVSLADPDHGGGTDYTVVLSREPYQVDIKAITLNGDTEIIFDGYGKPDSGGTVRLGIGDVVRIVSVEAQTGKITINRVTVGEGPTELPSQPPVQTP